MCDQSGAHVILVACGSQQRSEHLSTIMVRLCRRGVNVSAMGLVYLVLEREDNDAEDEGWDTYSRVGENDQSAFSVAAICVAQ